MNVRGFCITVGVLGECNHALCDRERALWECVSIYLNLRAFYVNVGILSECRRALCEYESILYAGELCVDESVFYLNVTAFYANVSALWENKHVYLNVRFLYYCQCFMCM